MSFATIAAAISLLLIIGVIIYLWKKKDAKEITGLATEEYVRSQISKIKIPEPNDDEPVVIKSDNGRSIYMDDIIDLKGGKYVLENDVIFNGGKFKNGTLVGQNTQLITHLFDCFENVKFEGTFRTFGMSYCNFGAVPNYSPAEGAVNDSYKALQAAFDSGFSVMRTLGSFYTSETLVIKNPIEVRNVGGTIFNYDRSHQKFTWHKNLYGSRQTVIYTDKNIDVITIQSPNVEFYGGLVDTSIAEFHNKAGYRYDMSYPIWGARLENIAVTGNRHTLAKKGNGTIGIHFDCKNASEPNDAKAKVIAGHLHMGRFSGEMSAVGIGTLRSENPQWKTSVNGFTIDFNMVNYKQAHVLPGLTDTYITGIIQEEHNLTESEKNLCAIEAGGRGTEIDVMVFDLLSTPKDGLYKRNMAIKVTGKGTVLGPRSASHLVGGKVENADLLKT